MNLYRNLLMKTSYHLNFLFLAFCFAFDPLDVVSVLRSILNYIGLR